MSFRCPQCHSSDALWEEVEVSGSRGIDRNLEPTGAYQIVDWANVVPGPTVGCSSCGWSGVKPYSTLPMQEHSHLEEIGNDDELLPFVHPDQTSLLDA